MYTVVDHNGDNGWIPQFEGLVKYWDWMATRDFRPDRESGVSITHEGIKEIEQSPPMFPEKKGFQKHSLMKLLTKVQIPFLNFV